MTPIYVGQWEFYPRLMVAQNMHNGTLAQFREVKGGWVCFCINVPATWMLTELCDWFAKWVRGDST